MTGDQATSKRQGGLFAVLNYVIGGGRQDARVSLGGRQARLDMIFGIADCKLVVEYDGAYWHRGREEQDFLKARRLESWYGRCIMVHVREYPPEPSGDWSFASPDVQVPARVDAGTCAQLVMLDLVHVPPRGFMDYEARSGCSVSCARPPRWNAAACCARRAGTSPATSAYRLEIQIKPHDQLGRSVARLGGWPASTNAV